MFVLETRSIFRLILTDHLNILMLISFVGKVVIQRIFETRLEGRVN